MLRSLLANWLLLGCAFALTVWIISGMTVSGGFWGYVWVAALFGIVNTVIGTVLRFITLPLRFLTLGLFGIVVNAVLLKITDAWSTHLTIGSFFWTAIWAALILSLALVVLQAAFGSLLRGR